MSASHPLPADGTSAIHRPFYVANAGSDSNDGLSPATAWQTIGKVNSVVCNAAPGTITSFNFGDVWRDDYVHCSSRVTATSTTTLANTPPFFSGTASAPIQLTNYGTNSLASPLFDAADPLSCTWSLLAGTSTVWQCAGVSTVPLKVLVDGATSETAALAPQANYIGVFSSSTAYHFLDGVTNGSTYYLAINPAGVPSGLSISDTKYWFDMTNPAPCNASEGYSASDTRTGLGLQNAAGGQRHRASDKRAPRFDLKPVSAAFVTSGRCRIGSSLLL